MRTSGQAFADITAALVREHDVADVLLRLVRDSADLLAVDAAAILVLAPRGSLEVLSATSHVTEELELYQSQEAEGPCVDAIHSGEGTRAVGTDELTTRWPTVGPAIVAAGFRSAYGFPLRFHTATLGALNVFSRSEEPMTEERQRLGQSLADVASLALVQPGDVPEQDLAQRVSAALEGRVVVERAKGVLAHVLELDMSRAYAALVERADRDGGSITATAHRVLADAQQRV
jgi:transcriptional regulator with GAF, ATPase, and Fis domain